MPIIQPARDFLPASGVEVGVTGICEPFIDKFDKF